MTDYGFKKVFGDEEIMKAFLTDLLEPKSPIETITFLDKELSAPATYERGVIYDLRCKTEDGGEFIVEMQNKSQMYFSDCILFYLSRSFSNQEGKGNDWDYQLKPVYGIFFQNFHLKGFKPMAVRTSRFCSIRSSRSTLSLLTCFLANRYYNALVANKVSATMLLYPVGGHGWFGNTAFPYRPAWQEALSVWLKGFEK